MTLSVRMFSAAVFLAATFANSGTSSATCTQDKNNVAQFEQQLKTDQMLLSQWCLNSLSTQCQQQGPGMTLAIKLLNEEIAAALQQEIPDCAPPPPPPTGLRINDLSPDTPFGAAAGGGPASGGRIHTLLLDPNSENSVLYAASTNAGVWKSTDGGHNWAQASIGLRNSEPIFENEVLAVDGNNSKRLLYASSHDDGRVLQSSNGKSVAPYGGLYISTDGAATWRHAEARAAAIGGLCPGTNAEISSVAFSSGQPFVAAPCGLFTNLDAGLADGKWTALPNVPSTLKGAIIAPNSYGKALFACSGNLIFQSTDLGQTWGKPISLATGSTCAGLSVVPLNEFVPDTVAVVYTDAKGVRHAGIQSFGSNPSIDLNFNAVATNWGSGVLGIFTVRRASAQASDTQPGVAYDVYAADGAYFYIYIANGSPNWKPLAGVDGDLHADSWSMAFPSTYDPEKFICTAFASNDGGVFTNSSSKLVYAQAGPGPFGPPPIPVGCDQSGGWVAAMSGLHTLASYGVAGVSQTAKCAGTGPCPALYLANGDNDVWVVTEAGAVSGPLHDGLGDAGQIFVDPTFPLQVVTMRGLKAAVVLSTGTAPPGPGTTGADITPYGKDSNGNSIPLFSGGALGPLNPDLTRVMALSGESGLAPLYFAIQGASNSTGPDSIIASSTNPPKGTTWVPAETGAAVGIFPHKTIAEIRSTGGLRNPILWLLTTSGKIYKGAVTAGKVSAWTQVSGIGKGGSLFVNPYNSNYVWVMDLANSKIMSSSNAGQTWTEVAALEHIATNNGEYRFDCGWSSGSPFFGWTCSLGWMAFTQAQPNIIVAALYPGGVAYSNDNGKTWKQVANATSDSPQIPAAQQNLRRLPISAWYDPNPVTGTPSIYVAIHGKGMIRVDGDFDTLPTTQ